MPHRIQFDKMCIRDRNFGNLEEMIIQLYQKGITTREIANIIEKYMVAIIRHKLFLI